ncbi:MAG TPA: hypothetical protein VJN70_20335 [Gemmatimonadaceae bacterium]|nr:hypothetical protein [Gemmatimonadaceae bacterium]
MSFLLAIPAAVVCIALYVIYDKRYHGKTSVSGLRATNEVFRDPSTGKLMRVFEDPRTGAREYVNEEE